MDSASSGAEVNFDFGAFIISFIVILVLFIVLTIVFKILHRRYGNNPRFTAIFGVSAREQARIEAERVAQLRAQREAAAAAAAGPPPPLYKVHLRRAALDISSSSSSSSSSNPESLVKPSERKEKEEKEKSFPPSLSSSSIGYGLELYRPFSIEPLPGSDYGYAHFLTTTTATAVGSTWPGQAERDEYGPLLPFQLSIASVLAKLPTKQQGQEQQIQIQPLVS